MLCGPVPLGISPPRKNVLKRKTAEGAAFHHVVDSERTSISDMKIGAREIVLLLIGVLGMTACKQPRDTPADTVLIHAKIYTVTSKEPWAQAIALRAAKIIAVGSPQELKKRYRKTTVEDVFVDLVRQKIRGQT